MCNYLCNMCIKHCFFGRCGSGKFARTRAASVVIAHGGAKNLIFKKNWKLHIGKEM